MEQIPDKDLKFLNHQLNSLRYKQQKKSHRKSYGMHQIIFLLFVAFIVWASQAELHESTKASGKIIDSAHIQNVNSLEGGIVKEILVKDDAMVQPGQVMIRLDTTTAKAKSSEDLQNYYRYLATIERLQAQLRDEQALHLSQELYFQAPTLAAQEGERFKVNQLRKKTDIENAKNDLIMKQQELKETKVKIAAAKAQYKSVLKQIKLIKPLVEKQLYSELEYLKMERDLQEQKAQFETLKASIKRLAAAVQQAKDRLNQVPLNYKTEEFQELRDAQSKLMEAKASLVATQDLIVRKDIRSPVMGTIRDLKIHTVGSTIQPGESILDIVPLKDTLLVEGQVHPADIGYLHPGMPAIIKVTAYDYSTYGGLDAVIESISPDTISDKKEESYYRIILRTKTTTLVKNGVSHRIIPGMQVEADILTGNKTVLKYLMKPFLRALNNSMTER